MSKKNLYIITMVASIVALMGSALTMLRFLDFSIQKLKYALSHSSPRFFLMLFFLAFFAYFFAAIWGVATHLTLTFKITKNHYNYVHEFNKNFQKICSIPYSISSPKLKKAILNYAYLVMPWGNLKSSTQIKNLRTNLSLLEVSELESLEFKLIESRSIKHTAFKIITILAIISSGGLIASFKLFPPQISLGISYISFGILIFCLISAGHYLYLTIISFKELEKLELLIKREISNKKW